MFHHQSTCVAVSALFVRMYAGHRRGQRHQDYSTRSEPRRLAAACIWDEKGYLYLWEAGSPSKLQLVVYGRTRVYNIDPFLFGVALPDRLIISALATHSGSCLVPRSQKKLCFVLIR
jgi:hypothetical protein